MQRQSTRVERRCEHCRAPFFVYPSQLTKPGSGRYCSKPCAIAERGSASRAPRTSPSYRPCERCGASFRVYPSAVRSGMGRYCSRLCSQVSRRDGEVRSCPLCGASFYAKRKRLEAHQSVYCSKKCEIADRARPIVVRFWERVDKNGPTVEHCPELGPCWIWTGYLNWRRGGYGYIGRGGRQNRTLRVHRYSWELHNGKIPDGMEVLHRCDNPPCVRPDHLFLGDQQANMDDMWSKGRGATGERQPSSRLTVDDVREIRRLWAAGGLTQRAIGERFGVSGDVVGMIVRRKTWTHVA